MAKIKTAEEIIRLRESGSRLARVLQGLKRAIAPGVSTKALDALAEKLIRAGGDVPPFLNYTPRGAKTPFPASLCVSLNDEIVHGIPSDERIIKDGDVVSIDLGLSHEGMITDAALTVPVGKVSSDVLRLVKETERALNEGIKAIRVGGHIGDIGAAIERVAKGEGYGIVRELGGHGVGHHVHEDPYVPNYGKKGTGPILKEGMVLALEPMFLLGKEDIRMMPDGYTVVSKDGSVSAHFEHTIVVTKNGALILTQIT
ncbi:MAG: type I methionyl aminopeptidase [Candidatus Lloydbacteria bacterium RIFCSPHIGHO2_02_FULL_54_17]|uniref:Methionine aminopeptidase n=1 Tax=Candidatus Lloydbacteria bacterium RIFCSPHIGHO2_02_FULL_54_17 TaxID=1798664 RepID=A0A1G2DFK2_9BACT|nr:MAG: type I methionyl aminopeptidase [Candidatus Lloydbacteria bacterium RIFCSPHIGHO2_01_FULL_54_11]OGZ12323.1 MAG: type I methionyl aminopeptidase [Candidatus Lloydbacteria bacterium RIFCSPHIGHO2_02_FULL_54_17]OGZ14506.1 MAG: type I methionyl aminopeptidase [Candidatus Lloydbacteria bacterium RIFCSPLOWO2_02_FULL_54_12]OGZ14584.1 MAG: type I methionyl aminopeptidase [Candidatus Lloydbacteria bacterium RIFCSPLOWO2_01_FULL_54_18]